MLTKAVLQLWEESERGVGARPSGATLHIDVNSREKYIKRIYSNRDKVPEYYEKAIGEPVDVLLKNNLLKNSDVTKLMRHELNNLLNMNEIYVIS
jgi:hypothetical protein